MKVLNLSLFVIGTLFSSCKEDVKVDAVVAPVSYEFSRNGNTNVSFAGQTTRIKMAVELGIALKDNTNSEAQLNGMFAHIAGNSDFSDSGLNTSAKNIRSKIAASKDFFSANTTDAAAIKAQFDTWMTGQATEIFPTWDDLATVGVAGQLQQADGDFIRHLSAKGLEYNQAIVKSIIGALLVDQILNHYLSTAVLDADNLRADNDADKTEDGKDYTTMEHKWDEAYGYLYGHEDIPSVPVLGADDYLNGYLGKVEENNHFAGIADDIYNAFKLGRAAIVAKNYALRNKQADIIKEKISTVIAVRTVHYLQVGKDDLATDKASAFHSLSKGFGFVHSLQFTRKAGASNPCFTKSEVDDFLAQLMAGNGFWDVAPETLDQISTTIAFAFGFTVEEAK